MSNPQRELSNEILKMIFLYLQKYADSKRTLGQCALTCRGWRFVAQSLIFYSLNLKNEKDIEDIKSMLLHNCMIKQWTRRLGIDFFISKASSLITIDKLLPRIEELLFSPPVYFSKDRQQKIDLAYFFLHELLAKDNKFNNLRILPIPSTVKQRELYVECLYVIRNNITDMKMYDVDNVNRLLYTKLCNDLHLFPHLKSVWASVNNLKPFGVVEHCESLLNKKNLSSIFLQELKIVIKNSSYSHASTLIERDNIFPASNIRRVFISIDYEGEFQDLEKVCGNLMAYIMKKFPNLNFLELVGYYREVFGSTYYNIKKIPLLKNEGPNRIRQLFPGVICQFLNYIYKIPNCRLQKFIVSKKEHTVHVLQKLSKEGIEISVPTLSSYNNWEEHSFITLDAKISRGYIKVDAYLLILPIGFRETRNPNLVNFHNNFQIFYY